MKTRFFTKNISLGLLMALVLAFSVQGIAEALTLTPSSDTIMEKGEDDPDFEISFSVGLKSDTTSIYDDNRKLIKDSTDTGGEASHRIDSQGYLVTVIDGKDYRDTKSETRTNFPPAPPKPAAPSDAPTGNEYADYAVYKKVSSSQYIAYSTGNIFANSSKNAFSSDGYQLYYYSPSFTYTPDGGTQKTAPHKVGPQIKIREEYFVDRVPKSNRYHYNDEAITISVAKNGTALSADATDMTVRLKSGSTSYQVNLINTIPTARATPPLSTSNASLWEGGGIRSLPSSITLICKSSAEGVYTVTIKDVTPANDFPANAPETLEQRTLPFTLRVTEGRSTTDYRVQALRSDGATTPYLRVDTGKDLETIHDDFKVTEGADGTLDADDNPELRYKIISGNGTLFAAANSAADPYRGPSKDITVHYTAKVFLNTNGTNNEVSVSIAGRDRQTHPATIVYEYSGTDRRTTQQNQNQQTARLTIDASATGTTRTVTVNALTAAGASVQGISVTLSGTALTTPQQVTTGTSITITPPSTPGPYTLIATDASGVYQRGTTSLRVEAPGTLSIRALGDRSGNQQAIRVTAQTSGGGTPSGDVTVTLSGVTNPRTLTPLWWYGFSDSRRDVTKCIRRPNCDGECRWV